MKLITLLFITIALTACADSHPDANDAELEAAASKGREMGAEAATLTPNSMEQQAAILEIRSRESAIREAGFPSCADTFAIEAEKAFLHKPAE